MWILCRLSHSTPLVIGYDLRLSRGLYELELVWMILGPSSLLLWHVGGSNGLFMLWVAFSFTSLVFALSTVNIVGVLLLLS